jgi:hypothetical protein
MPWEIFVGQDENRLSGGTFVPSERRLNPGRWVLSDPLARVNQPVVITCGLQST